VINLPNVTISVADELKAEMDKFPEVSWSEISRKAITRYIEERKNPVPRVEYDLREVRLDYYSFEIGSPTLTIPLRIHNMMESEIVVDRVIFEVRFVDKSHQYAISSGYDLYKRVVGANSVGEAQLVLELPREKIALFAEKFTETFYCYVRCTLFAENFRSPYSNEVRTKIAIDEWEKVVKNVLQESKSLRTGKGEARQGT
jgi:hypothetical protein